MAEEKTWMPLVAGILIIVSAAFKILTAIGMAAGLTFMHIRPVISFGMYESAVLVAIMVPSLILGVVALAGGIFALRRKSWGMALAGSIAAFLPSGILGILAIIFVVLSRNEFE